MAASRRSNPTPPKMPAPPDVIEDLAESAVADHEALLESTVAAIAGLWLIYGGPSDSDRDEWRRMSLPVLQGAAQAAAVQGDAFARTLAAFELDLEMDGPDIDLTPNFARAVDRNRRWDDVVEQIESHVDSPVIRTRFELSLGRAFDEAMDTAGAKAASQASGDVKRAYRRGVEHGATRAGTKVARYLKMPNPGACSWCFAVAGRGYRSATSVPSHANCRCGVRPVFVAPINPRSDVVANAAWYQALEDAGYGSLVGVGGGPDTNLQRGELARLVAPLLGMSETAIIDPLRAARASRAAQ